LNAGEDLNIADGKKRLRGGLIDHDARLAQPTPSVEDRFLALSDRS
jgi:hypothetical protein